MTRCVKCGRYVDMIKTMAYLCDKCDHDKCVKCDAIMGGKSQTIICMRGM